MQTRKRVMAVALSLVVLLTSGVFADESCTDCHDDTTLITGKQAALSTAVHGTGTAYLRGTSSSCAGCHSGGAFSDAIAAGLTVDQASGDPSPTRQSCRACHQIHTSYTSGDWALETVAPVTLFASDAEYDGGKGNLCANCHQPRRAIAAADADGMISVTSSHWGPHHGPQSAMLLGVGGAGVEGEASGHSWMVEDTCVTCHIGESMNHNFAPTTSACTECHDDAENFDIGGVQTQVEELIGEVEELLVAKGLLAAETEWEINEDGVIEEVVHGYHPVVGKYPADQASALWNYIFIVPEDGSLGVHNPSYTIDMLEAAKAALQ